MADFCCGIGASRAKKISRPQVRSTPTASNQSQIGGRSRMADNSRIIGQACPHKQAKSALTAMLPERVTA